MKVDGTIDQYKIRLRQQEDVNYFNTYSHVPRITSVRILIAITIINKLEIHQMDIYIYIYIYIYIAFLNGDLEEEVYMEQPEGLLSIDKKRESVNLLNN